MRLRIKDAGLIVLKFSREELIDLVARVDAAIEAHNKDCPDSCGVNALIRELALNDMFVENVESPYTFSVSNTEDRIGG